MNLYFAASEALERLDAKQGSIKGVLAALPENGRKRISALTINTLKYKTVLSEIITASGLLKEEKKKIKSLNLALVLVHDLLFTKGIQAGDGPVKQAILRHKTRLKGELQKIKIKRGARNVEDLAQDEDERASKIPRYVRVNTRVWDIEEAISHFLNSGYKHGDPFTSSQNFEQDKHVPDLLVFSSSTRFQEDSIYSAGKIILQDKASCFSALVLSPPISDDAAVIDATAAPGNKTTHLSALMQGRGKLFAFERDRKRFGTLKMMLAKARCENVVPINTDFLAIDPKDPMYSTVTHILLDPSCSGSGIVNRMDYLLETEEEGDDEKQDRLSKLASFQLSMIQHAMRFTAVQRIVYSTCSIHATENEHVVRAALKLKEATDNCFVLAPHATVLPGWPRRGIASELDNPEHANSLIRCSPGEDATNGFFVSAFVRRDETNVAALGPAKRKADVDDPELTTQERKRKKKKRKALAKQRQDD